SYKAGSAADPPPAADPPANGKAGSGTELPKEDSTNQPATAARHNLVNFRALVPCRRSRAPHQPHLTRLVRAVAVRHQHDDNEADEEPDRAGGGCGRDTPAPPPRSPETPQESGCRGQDHAQEERGDNRAKDEPARSSGDGSEDRNRRAFAAEFD